MALRKSKSLIIRMKFLKRIGSAVLLDGTDQLGQLSRELKKL